MKDATVSAVLADMAFRSACATPDLPELDDRDDRDDRDDAPTSTLKRAWTIRSIRPWPTNSF